MRFFKSLVACIGANLCGWLIAWVVDFTWDGHLNEDTSHPILLPLSLLCFSGISTIYTVAPTAILGLPIQALLQRMGATGIVWHVLTALIVGWPLGVIFGNPMLADDSINLSLTGKPGSELVPAFLYAGAIVFWFIRRPDWDRKADGQIPGE